MVSLKETDPQPKHSPKRGGEKGPAPLTFATGIGITQGTGTSDLLLPWHNTPGGPRRLFCACCSGAMAGLSTCTGSTSARSFRTTSRQVFPWLERGTTHPMRCLFCPHRTWCFDAREVTFQNARCHFPATEPPPRRSHGATPGRASGKNNTLDGRMSTPECERERVGPSKVRDGSRRSPYASARVTCETTFSSQGPARPWCSATSDGRTARLPSDASK